MRAARLISMVLLLQAHGAMTAAELAAELAVSERTVHRDARALSEAGVPVYAERGRHGGYRLVEGYRTRLTGLDRAEAQALFLIGLPDAARDLGLGDATSAARRKMTAALPSALRDAPLAAAARFHLDAPRWFRTADPPPLLAPIAEAVWSDRAILATYRRSGGGATAPSADPVPEPGRSRRGVAAHTGGAGGRVVQPYGLVLKAGVWYLVGRVDGGFRVYRVNRFADVTPAGTRFVREPGFVLSAVWTRWSAEFARSLLTMELVVLLSPAGLRRLPHVIDPAAVSAALASVTEPDADGRVRATVPAESPDVAFEQLLRLGPEAEVLAPAALRARLAEATARMAAQYTRPPT